MGFATDLRTLGGFRGTLPEFAQLASRVADALGLDRLRPARGRPPADEGISERVIRDYVSRGVLSPTLSNPETGRGGLYGFRHLLELLAARVLLADGWPLDLIAEHFRNLDDEELLQLIPGQPTGNPALELARRLRQGDPDPPRSRGRFSIAFSRDPEPLTDPLMARARLRAELPALLVALGGEDDVRTRDVVCLEITPWLTVLVDRERHRQLSPAQAERIGRAVAAALVSSPAERSRK
ncbi:MAG: MerR family transcriptional regulator [Sphingomonadaceae bacterium]|uniref:MerR family transcriptional regulator n=1 Tax=Thermaurantiacus sp. TaxID=2820283 RepID=UPI00298F19FF|nr:MerR family transcriptional regulator [Thermaurantiacus sp.]MCS6986354.1 MerR family transcriptional regulator [Sphingomonadaceae bacterium]MDW8414384.1 MerR family transcriptional regulator [Thermaurantiacus sp.]